MGNYGVRNQLTIANSGTVYNTGCDIGSNGGSSNTVLVAGANSVWTNNGNLNVGNAGAGDQLTITNGGTVYSTSGAIGNAATSSNNTVLVTDAGSVWSNSGWLFVGNSGAGNQLTIANSGAVYNNSGNIGNQAGADSSTVFVSGRGSVWRMTGNLVVNNAGTGNSLILSNGGVAAVSGTVTINSTGYVTNYVAGIAGGLDMAGSTLTLNGKMGIVFTAAPTQIGPFWGLRWAGSHVAALQSYTNSAALTISDTALPDLWRNRASIYYDGTNTYVGFFVSHLPVGGTIVTVF